jgi:hypothetical protein
MLVGRLLHDGGNDSRLNAHPIGRATRLMRVGWTAAVNAITPGFNVLTCSNANLNVRRSPAIVLMLRL